MTYPASCQRLRIGGTISGSVLSGGTVLESAGRNFLIWDGLMGNVGKRGSNVPLLGRDGSKHLVGKPYRERLFTLALIAYDRDDTGLITLDGRFSHLEDNIDLMLRLLSPDDDEQVIIERTIHLGETASGETETIRWILGEAIDPANFIRGPVFGVPHSSYAITVPMVAAYPFWQSEAEESDVVNGANVIVVNDGNARDSAAVYTFAGNGTLTHNDTGLIMAVAGAANPVEIDMAAGTIIEDPGGTPVRADRRMTPNRRAWMMLRRGNNDLTSTVSVTIKHRHQYKT